MTLKKNPWFRMYSDFMFDEKVEFLSFEDQRHYVFILCMKNAGLLDKDYAQEGMLERVVAKRLGLYGEAFESAKRRLIESGLIDTSWQPLAWEKRQMRSDSDPTGAERQRRFRESQKRNALHNGGVTRLEEEEEEEEDTEEDKRRPTNQSAPDGFDDFWKTYPKKVAKPAAIRAFKAARINGSLPNVLTHIRSMATSESWTKSGGQFVPNPSTYLNQRRWEDEGSAEPASIGRFV